MSIKRLDKVHHVVCHECKPLHATLVQEFLSQLDAPDTRKTHLFNGRYENIYIDQEKVPAIKPILQSIVCEAAKLLNCPVEKLQIGYWFNLMRKDDVTTMHTHDDDDELLSGTYYIQMPENSGRLKIKLDNELIDIEPVESTLTFFDPSAAHEVTRHDSNEPRISIGFNLGLRSDGISD